MQLGKPSDAVPDSPPDDAPIEGVRRDRRDALVLLGIAVVTFVCSDYYDIPRHIFEFGMAYENWKLDDVIFVSFVLGILWMIYGIRRYQDLTREITARRSAELEARQLARHDPLTGLPNRRFFAKLLDECLRNASEMQQAAILMLDLDGFKMVNDRHGHATGDKALREFARRVSVILRSGEILARIGGDEFAIIMPAIRSLDEPTNLARRIAAAVAQPIVIDSAAAEFGVGVGISIAPNDGTDPDELLKRADRALYRAKGAGRSSVCFFEPEMDAHVDRRIQIERELRAAIASNAIVAHYQPLVSLDGNRIIGFEALARWESEDLGSVPPATFIPIAEETGLINVLGDQLLRCACRDANTWPADFTLAFNVSPI